MSDCGCGPPDGEIAQRRVLAWLLAINGVMFVAEFGFGWMGQSTGLIADSLDMLADAAVYGIALCAVGREMAHKRRAARVSGLFQVVLGVGVAVDVARRLIAGSAPESAFMIGVGLVALVANVACLALIARHRDGEVHMRASWVFSRNDVIANSGVIAGGVLVGWTGSALPDLTIGMAIALLVVRGGLSILRDADRERGRA